MSETDNENAKNLLAVLGIPVFVVLLFVAFIPFGIYNAWVTQKLYNWFLLPIHGFPHLNLWWVWGITLLIGRFTSDRTDEDDKNFKKFMGKMIGKVFVGLLVLLAGYILKGHIHA